jgi:hypothetical protein
VIQKKCMTIFFLTSFFICLIIHNKHIWNLMWGQVWVHVVYSLMIVFSQLVSNIFSITLCIWLGFPHPLALGYHITFMANLWTLWGSTFFVVPMVGRVWLPMMLCGMQDARCKISSFTWIDSHSFITHLSFFMSTNQHCDFNGWYLDIGFIIDDPTLKELVL